MLRIRDPEATLHFYTKLMGMRTIFAYNTGPITVYYLGYPQTATHRADPATFSRETAPVMARTLGLLELCHYHGTEKEPDDIITTGTKAPHMGFGHLGFTVPDVKATTDRLREAGVKVLKEVGVAANEYTPITDWDAEKLGLSVKEIHDSFKNIVSQVAFVEDPVSLFLSLLYFHVAPGLLTKDTCAEWISNRISSSSLQSTNRSWEVKVLITKSNDYSEIIILNHVIHTMHLLFLPFLGRTRGRMCSLSKEKVSCSHIWKV